jgi:hypothetical protein
MEAGLPDGAIRSKPAGPLAGDHIRAALANTVERLEDLEPARREVLFAWLSGWRHHWPAGFRDTLGLLGERCLTRLAETPVDPNRYLKLRRIAVENLSGLL